MRSGWPATSSPCRSTSAVRLPDRTLRSGGRDITCCGRQLGVTETRIPDDSAPLASSVIDGSAPCDGERQTEYPDLSLRMRSRIEPAGLFQDLVDHGQVRS